MRPTTLARLALAGSRTDTLRVVLTAASAALATLLFVLAAAVATIPHLGDSSGGSETWARQYRLQVLVEPGLRPGVIMALALLTIPVLALAGQCGRLGAPARDRRLATIRLAGATPGQAVLVAAAETGVASGLGSVAGLALYLVGRRVLHRPDADGRLLLPTDVVPPAWALVAIVLGLPLLATGVAALLLRRVAFTPYGIARQVRRRSPRVWVGLLMGIGVALVGSGQAVARWAPDLPDWVLPVQFFAGVLAGTCGLVFGTGWISAATGRVLLRFGRGPAALLAARRLMADPWSGSRVFAVLLVGVLFGAGAAGLRAHIMTIMAVEADSNRWSAQAQGEQYLPDGRADFHATAFTLVDGVVAVAVGLSAAAMLVAVAEGIVSRRRAYASLVATGVPRRVLARAALLQALAPAVPAVVLALTVGGALARAFGDEARSGGYDNTICVGGDWSACEEPGSTKLVEVWVPEFVRATPVPFAHLALLGAGTLAAVALTVAVGLLFLRPATDLTELRAV
ncbi:hypothetical protein GCM10009682_51190 [Luedemannella flava]|uniref:ABC3 transporter permease C-terminal domain-containing protein n=1 Tax=Luedemannella flava TaxID=349316 RepID=A0ABN2MF95_9ACTN